MEAFIIDFQHSYFLMYRFRYNVYLIYFQDALDTIYNFQSIIFSNYILITVQIIVSYVIHYNLLFDLLFNYKSAEYFSSTWGFSSYLCSIIVI